MAGWPFRADATRRPYRFAMIEKRRSSAKSVLGRQGAETKRGARGKRFVGDDTGGGQGRVAELARVHRMQVAARESALRAERDRRAEQAREEHLRRPLWEGVAGLVLGSARLAVVVATAPLRMARAAVGILPFVPRWRPA